MESNDSPVIPDRGETPDIPGLRDKGAHQSYLGAERNTPVIPNFFNLVNAAVACAILKSISGLEPSSGT